MFFRKSRNTDKYICERKISNLKDVIKQYVDAFLKLDRHEQNIKFLLNRGYTLEYVKINDVIYQMIKQIFKIDKDEDIARFFKCDRITGKVAHNSNMTIEELKKFYCSLGCDCTDFSFSKEIELKNICISI